MGYADWIWLLWDLGAVLVFAWFIWQGAAKGLLRTIISLLGYVLAAGIADYFSPMLAKLLYDRVVRDALRKALIRKVEDFLASGGAAVGDILQVIPFGLQKLINPDSVESAPFTIDYDLSGMVDGLLDAVLMEPVLTLLKGVVFLLLFTLLVGAIRWVARLFTGVYRIPVVGTVNTLLGGLLGMVEAGLILLVASLGVYLLVSITGGFWWISESVFDSTYVWRVFYRWIVKA